MNIGGISSPATALQKENAVFPNDSDGKIISCMSMIAPESNLDNSSGQNQVFSMFLLGHRSDWRSYFETFVSLCSPVQMASTFIVSATLFGSLCSPVQMAWHPRFEPEYLPPDCVIAPLMSLTGP
ncbi:hypothetical protein V6N11_073016 [Hibiscus sabdariffa]|uniref:Uncharacterized protein n=1 Tax=Hibiscus sabdariffa TaxID=183260 RepID=A0ABR2NX92_9ROSI